MQFHMPPKTIIRQKIFSLFPYVTAFAEKLLRIFPFPMPKLRGFAVRFQVSGRRNTKAKLQP